MATVLQCHDGYALTIHFGRKSSKRQLAIVVTLGLSTTRLGPLPESPWTGAPRPRRSICLVNRLHLIKPSISLRL